MSENATSPEGEEPRAPVGSEKFRRIQARSALGLGGRPTHSHEPRPNFQELEKRRRADAERAKEILAGLTPEKRQEIFDKITNERATELFAKLPVEVQVTLLQEAGVTIERKMDPAFVEQTMQPSESALASQAITAAADQQRVIGEEK